MTSLAESKANLVSTLSQRLPDYYVNQNRELTLPYLLHEGNLVHFKTCWIMPVLFLNKVHFCIILTFFFHKPCANLNTHPGRVKVSYEVKRTRKEATLVWFEALFCHFPEGKEEKLKYRSGQLVLGPIFERWHISNNKKHPCYSLYRKVWQLFFSLYHLTSPSLFHTI
jgi:hypothetical protein